MNKVSLIPGVMGILFSFVLAALMSVSARASENGPKRPMSPVDMVELPSLGAPYLSPDGKSLLYKKREVVWTENKRVSRLRFVDVATGASLPFFDRSDEGEKYGMAAWRPDGAGFLILIAGEKEKIFQAYYFDLQSGVLTQITRHPTDIEAVVWAGNGRSFLFLAENEVLDDPDWVISEFEDLPSKHLWRQELDGEASQRLTSGEDTIRDFDLSNDGNKILLSRAPGRRIDDAHDAELWLMELASGRQTKLTSNSHYEKSAKFSPQGDAIAYIAGVNRNGKPYYQDNLFVQQLDHTEPTLLAEKLPYEIDRFYWSRDSGMLYFQANMGVRTELFSIAQGGGGRATRLTHGDHVVSSWRYHAETNQHILRFKSAVTPGDFWMSDGAARLKFLKITQEYDALDETFLLPRVEVIRWKGRGGVTLEGLLAYPLDYVEGRKFPLVTISHGGPRSSANFSIWSKSRHIPVLTGMGYGVFLPNYRGGVGYGDKFMRDMVGRYFRNAPNDVLDGVDYLITQGLADPDRLVKKGWSAGGHMTNKIITITNRFKAASSGAGAVDWRSMHGESDVRYKRSILMGGAPWEENAPTKTYISQSVLQDLWRVQTSTLIFVGENDIRVPPTQSILLYRGLEAANVPTELYIAPGQKHNFSKPSYLLFLINKELAWFEQHVRNEKYEYVIPIGN